MFEMQNVYSELMSILRSGQPATLYTRKTGDDRVEKWVVSEKDDLFANKS